MGSPCTTSRTTQLETGFDIALSVIMPVYRSARSALSVIDTLGRQKLPPGCFFEILAIDDGSGDDTYEILSSAKSTRMRAIQLPTNSGRGAAINTGVSQARGRHLVFMDCDCKPLYGDFLALHLEMLASDCVAVCGPLVGFGSAFWSEYQNDASARRAQQHARGISYAGTTANFSVQAGVFRNVGGFDERYKQYGFEDRDLLVRLSRIGRIGWCQDAKLQHLDLLTLPGALAKMRKAAGSSALIFSKDHPKAYHELGYAAIDSRLHTVLRWIGWLSKPLTAVSGFVGFCIERRLVPYLIARMAVRLLIAFAFIQGSMASIPHEKGSSHP